MLPKELAQLIDNAAFNLSPHYIPSLFEVTQFNKYKANVDAATDAQKQLDKLLGYKVGKFGESNRPEEKRAVLYRCCMAAAKEFAAQGQYIMAVEQIKFALSSINAEKVDFATRNQALKDVFTYARDSQSNELMQEAYEFQKQMIKTHKVPFVPGLLEQSEKLLHEQAQAKIGSGIS